MHTLEAVVPCYNEEPCIETLYQHLTDTLDVIDSIDWSVIFVDDGSTDKTLELVERLAEQHGNDKVKYISFSRNFGKEAAILAGLAYSTADYVVLMDADLQHPPEILPQMIDALDSGYDCCGAKRVTRGGEPPARSFLSKAFYKLTAHLMEIDLSKGGSDFKMMKRPVVDAMVSMPERRRFTKGIMAWVGFNTKWIEYENVERLAGSTKWSVRSLTRYAIGGIISFAKAPFLWAVYLGGFIVFLTLLLGIIYAIRAIVLGLAWGHGLFLFLIALFCGMVILILGMLGEYMVQIYREVQSRPLFIIKNTNIK